MQTPKISKFIPSVKATPKVLKKATTVPCENSCVKSLYENNGVSRAVAANYASKVSFSGALSVSEVKKMADAFVPIDSGFRSIIESLTDVFKTPAYKVLDEVDKKVFSLSLVIDKYLKNKAVDRTGLSAELKTALAKCADDNRAVGRILNMLDNNKFIEELSKREDPSKLLDPQSFKDFALMKTYGIKFRRIEDVEVFKLLVQNGFGTDSNIAAHLPAIDGLKDFISNRINSSGIWLPVTKIPNASDISKAAVKIGEGSQQSENVVIDLFSDSLEKLGFNNGVSKEGFTSIGHAVDGEKFSPWLQDFVSEEGTDALLSASYFQDANFPTFMKREYGLFLDVDPRNIALADSGNMASGFAKDFIDFKNNLLNAYKPERVNFSNHMCEILGIDKQAYPSVYNQISKARTIDDIADPKVKEALTEAIKKTVVAPDGGMNEIVLYAPTPTAVFTKNPNIEQMPFALRKYAQDKNIPIVDISKFNN